jgi:translation initiation factor IF-2
MIIAVNKIDVICGTKCHQCPVNKFKIELKSKYVGFVKSSVYFMIRSFEYEVDYLFFLIIINIFD